MDFFQIKTRRGKNGLELYPDFRILRSSDLMTRAKGFYAIWNEALGLWSRDEYDVQLLVDQELAKEREVLELKTSDQISVKFMGDFSTSSWTNFRNYLSRISDNFHELDTSLTFANSVVEKKDYVSRRLSYSLEEGVCEAYHELMATLYDPEEREKLEWAIGSVIAGEAKSIQKFIVLYGEAGAGKSTVLNIIQKLFEGYYTTFEAKALTSSNNAFSTEVFRDNPLVAIQHDGDLSKIEDNSKLNSIVSHEYMTMNEKYKPSYTSRINCFLFMATNKPVKISDAKSGIIRRLIDVSPSGRRFPIKQYLSLVSRVDFELGAIASHCLGVYRDLGKDYFNGYIPRAMIFQTDPFFNFVEANFEIFSLSEGISLAQAWALYKEYCKDSDIYLMPRYKFREELKNYFQTFDEVKRVDGRQVRSYFTGLLVEKFVKTISTPEEKFGLILDKTVSLLDDICAACPAQYASRSGIPEMKWEEVKTTLSDLNTHRVHYLRLPPNHIVVDFDLTDPESGEKSLEMNLEAASLWPPTYAEYSKSGQGLHLHYYYSGDVDRLSGLYSEGIEIKIARGLAALRRRLSKCNDLPIATLSSGLPLRGEKVIDSNVIKTERGLRSLIERNLRKEIHPATKPSIDFIYKILEEAKESNLSYDLTDMRPKILAFAMGSTNQSDAAVKLVGKMSFRSEDEDVVKREEPEYSEDDRLVFYDVEVFPNLFLVCWKYAGADEVVIMVNPPPQEMESFLKLKLVGFNCRRYDNHIVYARYLGYTVEELYRLSIRIINDSRNAFFTEAYNVSYADIYDFSSVKKSLKRFQVDLGIDHKELGLPWDQPVPENLWSLVEEYCKNDVISTEAVFNDRKEDFDARCILSELSGLRINDTTQRHTAAIIFGEDKRPQDKFVYTDLSELFPGYRFDGGKSFYRGEETGEGGYVYAEPGIYENVALLDISSMHPTSIELLNLFGPYTKNFSQLLEARLAIKHRNYAAAKGMLNGVLEKYLGDEASASALSYALKIVINIVYGLTSASFENSFRDPRNKDNIVAKRGSLFMIDLKHALQERGERVVHIKTDSVKIPNASEEVIAFVKEFGVRYGYTFELEDIYSKLALTNNAVYIAKGSKGWTATGAQFAHPYVFKTLFSKEPIEFNDLCEVKSVTTDMVLDMNEGLGSDEHRYQYVGRVGRFTPVLPGSGGGLLLRTKGEKYYAVTGTKNLRWLESEVVKFLEKEDVIDFSYFNQLVEEARASIARFGDFDAFVS